MFDQYFNRYLLDNHLLSEEAIAGMTGATGLPYPIYIDKFVETGYLTRDEAEQYVAGFRQEYSLDTSGLEVINSGDPERIVRLFLHFDDAEAVEANFKAYQEEDSLTDEKTIVSENKDEIKALFPTYIHSDPLHHNRFVMATMENIGRFLSSSLIFKKAALVQTYPFACLASQEMGGAHRIFLGIAGKPDQLALAAGKYAKRDFVEMDKRAFDSICELINCISGLYASKLSRENVLLDIMVPTYHINQSLSSNGPIYRLPVFADGAEFDVLFSFDTVMSIGCF